jgi:hypothetical protein
MKASPDTNLQRMYARPGGLVSALAGVEGVIHSSTSQGRVGFGLPAKAC